MRAIWNISHMHMAVSDADESASSDRREVSTWCANVVDSNVQLQLLLKSKTPRPSYGRVQNGQVASSILYWARNHMVISRGMLLHIII